MSRETTSSVRRKQKFLTVREVIKLLEAMPDKEMAMMIDCPYCGGSFYEVEVSEAELGKHCGPQEAIAKAKEKIGAELLGENMGHVKSWEVQEDFV